MRGLSANSLACHCEEQSDEAISRPRLPRSLRSLAMARAALAMTTRQWMGWRNEGGEDLGPLAGGEDEKGQSSQPKPMEETGDRTPLGWIRNVTVSFCPVAQAATSGVPHRRSGADRHRPHQRWIRRHWNGKSRDTF